MKAKSMNVPLSNIFGTLQTYLGSSYVNDLTLFGRTYRVTAQADAQFRLKSDDIRLLKTRNSNGGVVPLGSVATVQEINGADKITRYNMFPAADISGQPAPGASTGDALNAIERLAKEILPTSFTTEWTEIAFQQKIPGTRHFFSRSASFSSPALASQSKLVLALALVLIVPMCISARAWRLATLMENRLHPTLRVLVARCKNASSSVRQKIQDPNGKDRFTAAVEASACACVLLLTRSPHPRVLPLVLPQARLKAQLSPSVFLECSDCRALVPHSRLLRRHHLLKVAAAKRPRSTDSIRVAQPFSASRNGLHPHRSLSQDCRDLSSITVAPFRA